MRSIWEIIMVITIVGVFLFGIVNLGDLIMEKQTLSLESVEILSTYSGQAETYLQNYTAALNRSEVDPYEETDLNDVEGFVQEYRDYKGRLDQLKEGVLLLYKLPDLTFHLIPGVEAEDLGHYIEAVRFIIWVLILILFIVGLKNGQLIPNF